MLNKIFANECENICNQIIERISDFQNKSFLITGATGLISTYVVNFLLFLNQQYSLNIKIYALARSKEKLTERFDSSKISFLIQDLNMPLDINLEFDYIIHAASNSHPIVFATEPVETMKTNLIGTINLLELAKKSNSKFLYLSTGEIYGHYLDNAYTENDFGFIDTKLVRSCYPESKRAGETLCMAYKEQYGIKVNIARLAYIYGATITNTNSRADAQFLRNALDKQDIILKSDGTQKRTYCYVADAVCALFYILINGENGAFYNIANPKSIVSIKEYAETLSKIAGVNLKFELPNEVEKKGYSKNADLILSAEKLINLGWKPMYDIKTGLTNCLLQKQEGDFKC